MPRCCVAAGCDSISGKGYSFHKFPRDKTLQRRWVSAVKRQRSNWDGPSMDSQLCSKHFEDDHFVTEGVCFCDEMGIPAVKRLKPDAGRDTYIHTCIIIFYNTIVVIIRSHEVIIRSQYRSHAKFSVHY